MKSSDNNQPLATRLDDSSCPRLSTGVRLQVDRWTGQPVLLFPEAVVQLSGTGSAIVSLCNGHRSIGDIVELLSQQFQAPAEVVRADVTRYLVRLRDRILVHFDGARSAGSDDATFHDSNRSGADLDRSDTQNTTVLEEMGRQRDGAPLTSRVPTEFVGGNERLRPLGLIAELTYRCPLHCPYCSNPIPKPSDKVDLTTEQWRRVLREAADLGVLHALFSGGEPLVRPDLEQLIAEARLAGLYTNLITSAVGFTPERARALQAAGLDSVQISFQAARTELADSIAGNSAHVRKLEAARITCDLRLPLTINVVLHRLNIDLVWQMIELADQLGARRLELASAQYYGWAMRNRSSLLPSRSQVQEAARTATAAREKFKGRMDVLYILPDYFDDRPKPCMNGWGRKYLAVNPSGDVLPCPTAGEIASLRFENVKERSLDWIWSRSEAFNRFRGTAWMPHPCKTCDRREIDFGGCRCQAALVTGDAANTDPVCSLSAHRHLVDEAVSAANRPSATAEAFVFRTNPFPSTTR